MHQRSIYPVVCVEPDNNDKYGGAELLSALLLWPENETEMETPGATSMEELAHSKTSQVHLYHRTGLPDQCNGHRLLFAHICSWCLSRKLIKPPLW